MPTDRDDQATQTQLDPAGFATTALRPTPQVSWTDASGPRTVRLDGRAVIGSASRCDIVLDDPAVSRLHAEVVLKDNGLWIHDLGSRNGTYVDGVLVTGARVPDGGKIRVGSTVLAASYARLPTAVALWPGDRFGPLLGRSPVMRELFARLAKVAATNASVLVQGETGTGKELVARAIHEASPRASGPFVVVDCGALPENLLEAELFGHTRGAFTGAVSARVGAIDEADGGTVFLDEVGEIPVAMQPKLLRVIESRTVRRVGESAHHPVDVRFVSATNRDLRQMVNAGAFREDLYFRLAVLPVTVPPLRERPGDVPLLVEHFLGGQPRGAIDPGLVGDLASRTWLGNVRELRNFVERARALGAHEALAMIDAPAAPAGRPAPESFPPVRHDEPFKQIRDRWLDHLEREYLRGLLAEHEGNITAVAQHAGLDRSWVHRLIKKHRL